MDQRTRFYYEINTEASQKGPHHFKHLERLNIFSLPDWNKEFATFQEMFERNNNQFFTPFLLNGILSILNRLEYNWIGVLAPA